MIDMKLLSLLCSSFKSESSILEDNIMKIRETKKKNAIILKSFFDEHSVNHDGFTKRPSKEGLKKFIMWKMEKEGDIVFREDLKPSVRDFANRNRIFIPTKSKRFSKRFYWAFDRDPKTIEDEWELLDSSSELWKEIRQKKISFHPDRYKRNKDIFKFFVLAEEALLNRKNILSQYHFDMKPFWIE